MFEVVYILLTPSGLKKIKNKFQFEDLISFFKSLYS